MLAKSNLLIASGVIVLLGLHAGAQMSAPSGNNNIDYQLPQRAGDYATAWQLLSDAKEPRERARAALQAVLQNLRHDAQAAPERQRAAEDVSKARDAYATARDRVLATLAKTDSYVELKNKAVAIDRQIKDIHEQSRKTKPGTGSDVVDDARQQVLTLSEERMRLGDKITAVEVDAMQAAGVEKLRDNWIAANQRLDQLQADQEARIARDPAVVAAQSRLADAESDVADARVKFVGSEAAYHAAMTLEEWQNQIRQTEASAPAAVYRDPWPYYYGNGYGGGFTVGFPVGGIIISNGGGGFHPRSMFDHDVSPINLADFTSLQPTKFVPQPQTTDSGPGSPSKPKRNN